MTLDPLTEVGHKTQCRLYYLQRLTILVQNVMNLAPNVRIWVIPADSSSRRLSILEVTGSELSVSECCGAASCAAEGAGLEGVVSTEHSCNKGSSSSSSAMESLSAAESGLDTKAPTLTTFAAAAAVADSSAGTPAASSSADGVWTPGALLADPSDWLVSGRVTNSFLFCRLFTIKHW